ncbi:MAG: hypothetical protein A2909_01935 [Candidatus Tagabacteria bacterium RIFCSPLOWO2_01_FULL_39_11]|uniref:Uncharacterized protein n=1 Tax=Candidatus Tagabacteria bacterium RIFCSPLOWO2_01_FULL_39_11 TaxID=1802295 RepID=A0A1G2LQ51_9BACT|nr:MAG: hypothetical protein A2909_01935 [Candidatus Tagabacteria bacterium RIFCSPLOWO2_01_FULL_39_11]
MSDDGIVKNVVRTISCLTRDNIDLGAEAFKIWKENPGMNPVECVFQVKNRKKEKVSGIKRNHKKSSK